MLDEYRSQHKHIRDLIFQATEAAILEEYDKLQDLLDYLALLVPQARLNHQARSEIRAETDKEARCFPTPS